MSAIRNVMTPKPATEVMDAMRRPRRSATTPNASAPIGRPSRDVLNTRAATIASSPGASHALRRQGDVKHVDEFGESGAADGSAPLLPPVRSFGDETRR